MQNHEKLKEIPVIMMSADGELESIATCLKNGAKDYIVKPIKIQVWLIFNKRINEFKRMWLDLLTMWIITRETDWMKIWKN